MSTAAQRLAITQRQGIIQHHSITQNKPSRPSHMNRPPQVIQQILCTSSLYAPRTWTIPPQLASTAGHADRTTHSRPHNRPAQTIPHKPPAKTSTPHTQTARHKPQRRPPPSLHAKAPDRSARGSHNDAFAHCFSQIAATASIVCFIPTPPALTALSSR